MKNSIALLTTSFFLFNALSFAGNGETVLCQKLSRKVSYPLSLAVKKIETTVVVKLSVTSDLKLVIQSVNSENEEMNVAIKQQIQKIKFTPTSDMIGKMFEYRFAMKVQ